MAFTAVDLACLLAVQFSSSSLQMPLVLRAQMALRVFPVTGLLTIGLQQVVMIMVTMMMMMVMVMKTGRCACKNSRAFLVMRTGESATYC